jgi:protoheme IX farnesyltransferase
MGSVLDVIKTYYRLTKPGIIYGNILSALGGFLFASQGNIDAVQLLATLFGMALVIAAACVCNNYIDRHIDAHMARTSRRALVMQSVSNCAALAFAGVMGILGFIILAFGTNSIVVVIGTVGFVSYVGLYTYAKRKTWHSTLIGTISGATPIIAGYTAASGRLDLAAVLLFVIMVIWQMPHFYAIAMFRKDEYAAAGVPIISVVRGLRITRAYTVIYIALLLIPVMLLYWLGNTGLTFLVAVSAFNLFWLGISLRNIGRRVAYAAWARFVFAHSLLFLLLLSIMLSVDAWLP